MAQAQGTKPMTEAGLLHALDVYFNDHDGFPEACDLVDFRLYREDIQALQTELHAAGIDLLDFEVGAIWLWHSGEWDASWLAVVGGDRSLDYFAEFEARYIKEEN